MTTKVLYSTLGWLNTVEIGTLILQNSGDTAGGTIEFLNSNYTLSFDGSSKLVVTGMDLEVGASGAGTVYAQAFGTGVTNTFGGLQISAGTNSEDSVIVRTDSGGNISLSNTFYAGSQSSSPGAGYLNVVPNIALLDATSGYNGSTYFKAYNPSSLSSVASLFWAKTDTGSMIMQATSSNFNEGSGVVGAYGLLQSNSTNGMWIQENTGSKIKLGIGNTTPTVTVQASGTGASSYSTGALVVNGGVGISGDAYFNSDIYVAGYMYGTATAALYADLAENYQADSQYEPGTVLVFGGDNEVTISPAQFANSAVAGIVSTNPAHLMNSGLTGTNVVPLALIGRVPCKVFGPCNAGDLMITSNLPGVATSISNWTSDSTQVIGSIIGKALTSKTDNGLGIIEVVVGRV